MLKISGLLLITFLNGVLLNYYLIQHKTIKIPSYIISLVFIFFSLHFFDLNQYLYIAITLFLFTLIYIQLINFDNSKISKRSIFNSGFFLALMTIIDINFIFFYFIILNALIYYSEITWKNFLTQLIGFIYPLGIYYILKILNLDLPSIGLIMSSSIERPLTNLSEYPTLIFILFILITLSIIELYKNYYKKTEKSKKAFNLLFLITVFVLILSAVLLSLNFIYLLVLPFTIIISNYLIYMKHVKFRTFLLGLLLISLMLKLFYL